jgi:VWFA-related protein
VTLFVTASAGFTLLLNAAQPAPQETQNSFSSSEPKVSIVPRTRPEAKSKSKFHSISVESNLVLVPVTVTDPVGKPVLGLKNEDFRVVEDGVEQQITHFANDDTPLSIGIVFDASASMDGKLDKSRAAISELFKSSMTGDEYFVVAFNDRPTMVSPFTSNSEMLQNSLLSIQPKGWTSLYDAVYLSINQMKKASKTRKALLVLSDGGDNNSRFTHSEIKNLLRESDVIVYAVGILGPRVTKGSMKSLSQLAEETGGRLFPIGNVKELPEAIGKISSILHDQYVLGYTPTNLENDGKYRKVRVDVQSPPEMPRLHSSWRSGYYAPF